MDKDDDQVLQGEALSDRIKQQMEFPEEAIPLVIFNEEKKIFELNEEGRQYLTAIEGPIGIIAVAGMYRTGKSYLLNRMLLDRSNGFGVGPTINPCTKGVWMWGKPVKGLTPDGDPINVVVMDTEGLGALDEDSNHDVRIFSLAILLSSYFIYNSVGSIDENALQNLSLVINLTKHIQIKSSGLGQDEVDPDEYSKYFPTFLWVVRDFTLQLVDQEGEQITAKEYLEKALQSQKGFSDNVEQKNRIRRLLKSFFTDRDCVTMIRPLTNEDKLQNLINIPMDELRPEFVEQITQLRRKVLHKIKPKKINGKNLTGAMFWNLLQSYVESINKGAIPSIESSWAYICKNECLKATDDSFDIFQKCLHNETKDGGPFYEQELRDIYSMAKKQALTHFTKVAVGEVKEKYIEDLKEKMKQKFLNTKHDNEQSCEQECIMFLRQSYTEIERALKNQQYPSFIDYLHDVEQFKQIFEENGPPGTNRKEILLDFCLKAVMESAEFFMGNFQNEMNLQRSLMEETIRKMQSELKEIKGEQKTKFEVMDSKLRKVEIEKAELSAREQSTKEQLLQMSSEKDSLENQLQLKIQNQKKEFDRQMEDINFKMSNADDAKKEIQRQQIASESEFDKQIALLDQKIEFLDKALEDSKSREKEISSELKNCKKDFQNQNKEQNQLLEKQIKDQLKQLDLLKEQVYEHENKYSELEVQSEEQKTQAEIMIAQLKKEMQKAKENESDLSKNYNQLKKRYESDCEQLKLSQQNDLSLNNERLTELEQQLKETQDTFEMAKQSWAKEEAVLKQKLEFVQYQLEDEKKKFEENKQAQESMLKSLQNSSRESVIGREEAQIKINEMEQKFMNERKNQEDQYNEYRNKMKADFENLKKNNNELELSMKIKMGEHEKEMGHIREQLSEATVTRDSSVKQLKTLESTKGSILQETEERYKLREDELEKQIEEKDQEIDDLIQENSTTSEKKLCEIKRFYEEEKERLERRIIDEKARAEKKLNQTVEDYEEKISEMTNNHEEAVNALEDDKNAIESDMQNILNQLEKENQVMQQQLENKDRYLTELKENYNNLQEQSSKQNEQQSEKFAKERRELSEKLEQLTSEISKRERAIVSIENQKESLMNQLKGKEQALDDIKSDHHIEKQNLLAKNEDLKLKYDQSMDELTQNKINFEREKALKDQRLAFQEQRIKEYNDQMAQSIERYEERLKTEKDESSKTLQERMLRIQQEKENVETKYEQKRKALKDLEKSIQQSQSAYDREKAVQIEKYENLERQQKDLINSYEIENQKLQEQNEQLNQALSQGELGIREQVEHWKGQYYEMERQHADLNSEFEKEKALWEGKFEFLEKQKDQAKKDNEEALRQFQQTVDQLQKSQNDSKSKHESNHNSVLQALESKFKKDYKENAEQYNNQITQLNSTIRRLEKENKSMNERLEITSKNSMSEQGGLEKKIERVMEERDRLKEDFDVFKSDREKKIDEMRRQYEREKDLLKQKNNDLQQKSKLIDSKQTELILSHETNRAKWDQEKSHLLTAKEDAIGELKNFQRKYENSVKEIERLKEASKRNNWRMQKEQRVGGVTTNNPLLHKIGENVLNRLNLGGAGGAGGVGATSRPVVNELSQSQSNFASLKEGGGIGGTYRSNFGGVDKSMENFKLGFGQKYGSQLGQGHGSMSNASGGGNYASGFGNNSSTTQGTSHGGGAAAIPNFNLGLGALNLGNSKLGTGNESLNGNPLDNSMRKSNILSNQSSKSDPQDEDQEKN